MRSCMTRCSLRHWASCLLKWWLMANVTLHDYWTTVLVRYRGLREQYPAKYICVSHNAMHSDWSGPIWLLDNSGTTRRVFMVWTLDVACCFDRSGLSSRGRQSSPLCHRRSRQVQHTSYLLSVIWPLTYKTRICQDFLRIMAPRRFYRAMHVVQSAVLVR